MYLVVVEGRKRPDPRITHETIEAAVLELHRLRELPDNRDRAVHVVQIIVTLSPLEPGRELRGIRE